MARKFALISFEAGAMAVNKLSVTFLKKSFPPLGKHRKVEGKVLAKAG